MNEQVQEIRYLVGEAWKGTYDAATTYGNANVVQDPTGLSVYRSLKPGNVGHPLTDANWWFCIINLSSIKAESDRIAALNQAIAQDEALRVAAEELRQQKEAEREAAETQRNEAEQNRISAEQQRVSAEQQRASQEQTRISQEQSRVTAEQGRAAAEAQRVQKEQLRENNEAQRVINETNRVAAEAERVAQYAADHQQAVADHDQYVIDNAQLTGLVERADADHVQAGQDHTRAESDHTQAGNDHTRAESDHSTAAADHTQAGADHTQAGSDHTRAESDHTRAESDHAAVEVYVDSLGVFDLSKHNAEGGVLATYADLSAALTALNALESKYKYGGMSFKFVQSSDNKYVQYRLMSDTFSTTESDWQGVDEEPTAGSQNLITSDAVYNESKKSDVILAIDKTDLSIGYYYDNTTGEKVANQNCWSNLIDIPAKTKEINVIWGGTASTVAFYGIAIYDAPIAELTDENISDHFIKGFTGRNLLEVSRIIVNDSYKSIAVTTFGNDFSSQVLFNALESCIHYGSRLLDVFYLNDNYVRSMVGKSVYLRTLDKTTGIVSLRDPVTEADYNVQSTVKKGKELLLSKNANYVYLGVLVDWDIIDYNFSNISQAADNTFVLSTPKSAEGQKFFDMIYNKKYRQTGNTTVNGDGVVSGFDCIWEDGTAGHVAYNTFDDDVLEYRSSIVTYGTSYAVYYGLKTFDEYGNITSETGLEIRVI